MNKLYRLGLATALLVAIVAAPAQATHRRVIVDRATVVEIGNEDNVTGRSVVVRTQRGVLALLRTSDLVAGDAYTVWAVIFNNPDACDGPCDASDLANPDVAGFSTLGTGKVADREGTMFYMRIPSGEQLMDPRGAEIHFVVRTHGPAIPDLVEEQISTLNGGCPPNTCSNVLMAKHD